PQGRQVRSAQMRPHLRRSSSSLVLLSGGSGELPGEHREKRGHLPRKTEAAAATLGRVRRRWLGVLAVLVAAAAGAAFGAVSQRGGQPAPGSPKPIQALPSKEYGDTADLMRRLEREKHVQGSR